jgi:Ca-activated chloride channel homolog
MKSITKIIFLIALIGCQVAWINPLRDHVKKANQVYNEEKYQEAIQLYTDIAATYAPESKELHFNIGDSWFKQEDFDKAIEEYQNVVGASDEKFEAHAHYNIGNAQFRKEDYQKAIESYIHSLKLNPTDEDAKYNLEVARRKLKEQIDKNKQQQDQQDKQQQNKDDQKQDQQDQQKQDQNKQDQQQEQKQDDQQDKKEEQQQQPKEQDKQDQEQEQEQPSDEQPRQEMTKEQAMQLLNNLEDDEKEKRKEYKRRPPVKGGRRTDKDW